MACNLCGADDFTVVYEAMYGEEKGVDLAVKFRSSGDEGLIDQVVRCNKCGLMYINPVLDPSIIFKGYSNGSDETFVSQNSGREKSFEISLEMIEKYVPAKGRVLDVGTAGGAFLHVAIRRGWEVAGCEPNKWLCQWAGKNYGIQITPGTIFELNYGDGSFDLITLWDVLEHTPDPRKVLMECNRLLKPGGLLIVNLPDIGSWIARLMGRKWLFLLSVHLYYFNKKTAVRMLDETGFQLEKIRPHYQYLELAYIFKRGEAIIGGVALLLKALVSGIGLGTSLVPYWIGQTLFIVRRR